MGFHPGDPTLSTYHDDLAHPHLHPQICVKDSQLCGLRLFVFFRFFPIMDYDQQKLCLYFLQALGPNTGRTLGHLALQRA